MKLAFRLTRAEPSLTAPSAKWASPVEDRELEFVCGSELRCRTGGGARDEIELRD